ncbi:hypothetical protein [Streptomyces sp. NPDC002889]|uniref:hypothetical protein n=1 Tax=Streptomyces sp. NPDC002889 TaxID=3364669 RepID=UPI0036C629C1
MGRVIASWRKARTTSVWLSVHRAAPVTKFDSRDMPGVVFTCSAYTFLPLVSPFNGTSTSDATHRPRRAALHLRGLGRGADRPLDDRQHGLPGTGLDRELVLADPALGRLQVAGAGVRRVQLVQVVVLLAHAHRRPEHPTAPTITSSSHAVPDSWYGTDDFTGTLSASDTSAITGYAVKIDQDPLTAAGTEVTQTRIGGLPLRVIEAEIRSRTADGGVFGGTYRLLTTLSDHRADPADHLVRLYHERWEIEITYLALRHTLLRGRVLRSKDPVGLIQEMWGLLTVYQALRAIMVTAVETTSGCDPGRAGFTIALEAARDTVVSSGGPAAGPSACSDLVGVIRRPRPAGDASEAPDATVHPHREVRNLPLQQLQS